MNGVVPVTLFIDPLGSNSLMTDGSGTVVPNNQAAYLPFGDWRNEPSTADLTDVGYTGHRHNNTASNNLGLIYMNARYYLPNIGRFASADTIVPDPTNPQSHNRYSYVYNNPLKFIDPDGHSARFYDEKLGAMVFLSDRTEQRTVEEMWVEFVQEQQAKLNANGREDVSFATSTEELRNKRFLLDTEEAAIPKTYREFNQVAFWGEIAVDGFINAEVDSGQCYCHVFVGTTFGLSGPLINTETEELQQGVFRSNNLIPYTNSVSIYVLDDEGNEFHVHSAVVAFNDFENPSNSILLQVNGSETNSGIYFTRLQREIDSLSWGGIAYLTIPLQVNIDGS